ncbi:hypothetical protein [Iodobacter fluviatilis]|uniref:Uncharacterized protein n=1 Tax=Iodobacter fluviatilis TaxID=537 RepID=A0A377Q447_9NEIS|nr:hypothetical protein [Iodobacter fluviatilis]TCU84528.1 hypothetical protein EV682_10953 [Iodobacter fluviatilis]STQ89994.1 Uncharacterised protein [Iodobacter fluviatilis]
MTREEAQIGADLLKKLEVYETSGPAELRRAYHAGEHDKVLNMALELMQRLAEKSAAELSAL